MSWSVARTTCFMAEEGSVQGPDLSFIVETSEEVSWIEPNFNLTGLTGGPFFLRIDSSKNMAAIVSFYYRKQPGDQVGATNAGATGVDMSSTKPPDVLLFQVTVSMNHPVDGEGIVRVLKGLDLWDGKTTPSVALVFIVPERNAYKFKQQRFKMVDAVTGDSPVQQVKGIGKHIAKLLKDQKIETVSQLEASTSVDNPVPWAKAALAQHKKRLEVVGVGAMDILEAIPQYVWPTIL